MNLNTVRSKTSPCIDREGCNKETRSISKAYQVFLQANIGNALTCRTVIKAFNAKTECIISWNTNHPYILQVSALRNDLVFKCTLLYSTEINEKAELDHRHTQHLITNWTGVIYTVQQAVWLQFLARFLGNLKNKMLATQWKCTESCRQ
jgi:hypothetical protein